jgi:hypothetical protein
VVMSVFRGGGGGLGIESDDLYIFLFEGAVRSCAQSESASCAECGEVLLRRADQLLLVAVVGVQRQGELVGRSLGHALSRLSCP